MTCDVTFATRNEQLKRRKELRTSGDNSRVKSEGGNASASVTSVQFPGHMLQMEMKMMKTMMTVMMLVVMVVVVVVMMLVGGGGGCGMKTSKQTARTC